MGDVNDDELTQADLRDETAYDRLRLRQWLSGRARGTGVTRRDLLRFAGAVGGAVTLPRLVGGGTAAAAATARPADAAASGPIVKPLPSSEFYVYGSNAEMRWEVMRGKGYAVPNANFFVRDHTSTPTIDVNSWSLKLFGTGLAGSPTPANPVIFTYEDLLRLPSTSLFSFIECAGNGRSFFTTQQNEAVSGTAWLLGAVGVAEWRGVRLSTVLERAGLTTTAVDVMPYGLDPNYVTGGVDYGPVRRPIPVAKALDDVILAYEMNGETLPPDSGFPIRMIVPSWVGISNIKWIGQIEVSDIPLVSYWNTQAYRLFGPTYPTNGTLVTKQVVKSAFELEWNGTLPSGQTTVLTGRSWSGNGRIAHTEISTDDGTTWRRATPRDFGTGRGWQLWEYPWRPPATGSYALRARATDLAGRTQPTTATYNTLGYLFDGIVAHPVTVG
jgi:DMSO/TMAO reductase YedYZ molybdopterin-dependent catalytic subunit